MGNKTMGEEGGTHPLQHFPHEKQGNSRSPLFLIPNIILQTSLPPSYSGFNCVYSVVQLLKSKEGLCSGAESNAGNL